MTAAVGCLVLRRVLRIGIGAIAVGAVGVAGEVDADGVPAPAELVALQAQVSPPRKVRLMGSFGTLEIKHALLDSTGVRSADWAARPRRPSIFLAPDAPGAKVPAPIPWSEISEIQTGQSRAGLGAALGFAGSLVMVVSMTPRDRGDIGAIYQDVALGMAGITAGTLLGSAIGSMHRWRTIYRRL